MKRFLDDHIGIAMNLFTLDILSARLLVRCRLTSLIVAGVGQKGRKLMVDLPCSCRS